MVGNESQQVKHFMVLNQEKRRDEHAAAQQKQQFIHREEEAGGCGWSRLRWREDNVWNECQQRLNEKVLLFLVLVSSDQRFSVCASVFSSSPVSYSSALSLYLALAL